MVTIQIEGAKLTLRAPYNSKFVTKAKALGGKWENNAWVFDARDADRVKDAAYEWYGTDGVRSNLCTMRVEWEESDYAGQGPLELAGRPIARAFGRDSGAKLADGVIVLKGGFDSGGSMKNWTTKAKAGTVVLVRDFPRAKAEKMIAEPGVPTCSIEEEKPVIERAALEAERARLQARLAEIEALLQPAS